MTVESVEGVNYFHCSKEEKKKKVIRATVVRPVGARLELRRKLLYLDLVPIESGFHEQMGARPVAN
jgi:hypothetical protein